MLAQMIPPQVVMSRFYRAQVANYIRTKFYKMDTDTIILMFGYLAETIRELDVLLKNTRVRTHLETKMSRPVIGEKPSLDDLLLRLNRQVDTVSLLAQKCNLESPANTDETETFTEVTSVLRRLHEKVMPAGSLPPGY